MTWIEIFDLSTSYGDRFPELNLEVLHSELVAVGRMAHAAAVHAVIASPWRPTWLHTDDKYKGDSMWGYPHIPCWGWVAPAPLDLRFASSWLSGQEITFSCLRLAICAMAERLGAVKLGCSHPDSVYLVESAQQGKSE